GKLNKEIVAQLQAHNCNAIGLSGADGNIIQADKRAVKEIDYGFAGDISKVNVPLLQQLFKLGLSPVICSLTHDKKGQLLNTNADTISNTIASSLSDKYKVNLYYLFELEGVLKNKNDQTSKINSINSNEFHKLIELKKISDGMIPKLHNAFEAIQKGVHQISIGNPSILDNPINGTMLKQM
ncbi:MAG: acetylglutamate kinase, partial [Bacteroidota bacterium]